MNALSKIDHERRMALYWQGMNDREMAEAEGCSTVAIRRWRKRQGLRPNWAYVREKPTSKPLDATEKKQGARSSICWSCIHAYGDDCFRIPFQARTWVQEYQQRKLAGNNQKGYFVARSVQKCSRFEYGRRKV